MGRPSRGPVRLPKTLTEPDTDGIDSDAVLGSLLHAHFLRACGNEPADKAACLYLARTAALAVLAQTGEPR